MFRCLFRGRYLVMGLHVTICSKCLPAASVPIFLISQYNIYCNGVSVINVVTLILRQLKVLTWDPLVLINKIFDVSSHIKPRGLRSVDCDGQFCRPPQPATVLLFWSDGGVGYLHWWYRWMNIQNLQQFHYLPHFHSDMNSRHWLIQILYCHQKYLYFFSFEQWTLPVLRPGLSSMYGLC